MNAVSIIPVGTVTFLFTDLEGSTRSWEQQGPAMSKACLLYTSPSPRD